MKRKWFSDIEGKLLKESFITEDDIFDDIGDQNNDSNEKDKKWNSFMSLFQKLAINEKNYEIIAEFQVYNKRSMYHRKGKYNADGWYMTWHIREFNGGLSFMEGAMITYENFKDYKIENNQIYIYVEHDGFGMSTSRPIIITIINLQNMNKLNYVPVDYDNLDSLLPDNTDSTNKEIVLKYFKNIVDNEKLEVMVTRGYRVYDASEILKENYIDIQSVKMWYDRIRLPGTLRLENKYLLVTDDSYTFWFFKFERVDPKEFI